MTDKKSIAIKLCIVNNLECVRNWMMQMKMFEPKNMSLQHYKRGKMVSYNEKIFMKEIENEFLNLKYNISLKTHGNDIKGFMNANSNEIAILSAFLEYDIFVANEDKVYYLINEIMNQAGVVGRIVSLEDNYWQNTIDIEAYKIENKSIDNIPIINHPILKGRKAVDVEKLPGHEEQIGNIWFGAVWKMWFNDSYYQYVSKESIENFKDCYGNEKISDTCRCITLYKNIFDYELAENREKQWKFKEAINFKETVSRLKEKGIHTTNDPHVEIFNGKFEHAGIKLFKFYFDNDNQPIAKSKASQVRIEEYNQDKKLVFQEIKTLFKE